MVQRQRRTDGASFWGCPRYPTCRGTRPIDVLSHPPFSPDPSPLANRDQPGASATRQFERRRATHEANVRAARPEILITGAVFIALGIALGLGVAGPTWVMLGWAVILFAVMGTIAKLFVLPQHVQAWDTGGEGERRTAAALEPLRDEGFVILHDRRIPKSVANIDHVVVGPTGVWVVESKSYTGWIRVDRGELRVNGRRRPGVRHEVAREVQAVAPIVAPVPVSAAIVVHRADFPLFGRPKLDGVPIVTARGLARLIRDGPIVLSAAEIAALAARIDQALPPSLDG